MRFLHQLTAHKDVGLFILRLGVGSIFLYHGIQKWALWGMASPPQGISENMMTLLKFLSVVEPIGGIALIFGFLTQLASLGLAIIMLGAILWFKMQILKLPFMAMNATGWEFDLSLLVSNIALFFTGGGKISLDRFIFSGRS